MSTLNSILIALLIIVAILLAGSLGFFLGKSQSVEVTLTLPSQTILH